MGLEHTDCRIALLLHMLVHVLVYILRGHIIRSSIDWTQLKRNSPNPLRHGATTSQPLIGQRPLSLLVLVSSFSAVAFYCYAIAEDKVLLETFGAVGRAFPRARPPSCSFSRRHGGGSPANQAAGRLPVHAIFASSGAGPEPLPRRDEATSLAAKSPVFFFFSSLLRWHR